MAPFPSWAPDLVPDGPNMVPQQLNEPYLRDQIIENARLIIPTGDYKVITVYHQGLYRACLLDVSDHTNKPHRAISDEKPIRAQAMDSLLRRTEMIIDAVWQRTTALARLNKNKKKGAAGFSGFRFPADVFCPPPRATATATDEAPDAVSRATKPAGRAQAKDAHVPSRPARPSPTDKSLDAMSWGTKAAGRQDNESEARSDVYPYSPARSDVLSPRTHASPTAETPDHLSWGTLPGGRSHEPGTDVASGFSPDMRSDFRPGFRSDIESDVRWGSDDRSLVPGSYAEALALPSGLSVPSASPTDGYWPRLNRVYGGYADDWPPPSG